MGRLTNNLINRPNLINFVRQFCAPFQLMIRVHATWHVSSSLSLPSPSSCTLSSTIPSFRAFGPTNFSLMKIDFREFEGRVPVLTPPSNGQAFFPPVRIFDFFFFFFCRFRHREQGQMCKIESNFYPRNEIVNAQLYNWRQFFSRTIICGISFLSLLV